VLHVVDSEPLATKPAAQPSVQAEPDGNTPAQLPSTTLPKPTSAGPLVHGFGWQLPLSAEKTPAEHVTVMEPELE
jgi:hypothetical protein